MDSLELLATLVADLDRIMGEIITPEAAEAAEAAAVAATERTTLCLKETHLIYGTTQILCNRR